LLKIYLPGFEVPKTVTAADFIHICKILVVSIVSRKEELKELKKK